MLNASCTHTNVYRSFVQMVLHPGCGDAQIRLFFSFLHYGDHVRALHLLKNHRPELMGEIQNEILRADRDHPMATP